MTAMVVLCLITSLQTHSHIHSYTLTCCIILTIHSHTSHTLNSHMTHISHQTLTIPGTTLTYQIYTYTHTHNHIYTYTQSQSHAQTQASLLRHNPHVLSLRPAGLGSLAPSPGSWPGKSVVLAPHWIKGTGGINHSANRHNPLKPGRAGLGAVYGHPPASSWLCRMAGEVEEHHDLVFHADKLDHGLH